MLRLLSQDGHTRGRRPATALNLSQLFASAEVRSSSDSAVWLSSSIELGREATCAVQVEGGGISRQHAKLRLKIGTETGLGRSQELWCKLQVADNGSKNGTKIARSSSGSCFHLKEAAWYTLRGERFPISEEGCEFGASQCRLDLQTCHAEAEHQRSPPPPCWCRG